MTESLLKWKQVRERKMAEGFAQELNILNLKFDETDGTKERLRKAATALIAIYGYEGTTTRMIANTAGVTLSAINFHYGSKEDLIREAMTGAAEHLQKHYEPLAKEVLEFVNAGPVDQEQAWNYIDRFLADRIRRAFNRKASWINIGLAVNEHTLPENCRGEIAKVAVEYNEYPLARLILAVSDRPDEMAATVMARSVFAAIMAYGEKPLINKYFGERMDVDPEDTDTISQVMHDYFMRSIEANTRIRRF